MSIFYNQDKDRRVVPNWRSYSRTLFLGELNDGQSINQINLELDSLDKLCEQYLIHRTLAHAGDLVSAASVQNVKSNNHIINEARLFIVKNKHRVSTTLFNIANNANERSLNNNGPFLLEYESIDAFFASHKDHRFNEIIRNIKNRLKSENRNSILWMELARYYSLIGELKKAERAVIISLNLSNENRYIIRSALRFFVQVNDYEKARYYVRRNSLTNHDPWVMSAAIAIGVKQNGKVNLFKKGERLISSNTVEGVNATELASSLGTVEFENGSQRKGIKYFRHSLIRPNDNSLAQTEWASSQDSRLKVSSNHYLNVINPYEARAIENYHDKDYKKALVNIEKWFLDVPYNVGAIELGSFITCVFFNDYEKTINICLAGLKANPKDPRIINNLAYAYAKLDEPLKAIEYLKRVDYSSNMDVGVKLSIIATTGLVEYKLGNINSARNYYQQSVDVAEKLKMHDYVARARGNQVLAEYSASTSDVSFYLKLFLDKVEGLNEDHCIMLKNTVMKTINSLKD